MKSPRGTINGTDSFGAHESVQLGGSDNLKKGPRGYDVVLNVHNADN
jgi:hypothetical protein